MRNAICLLGCLIVLFTANSCKEEHPYKFDCRDGEVRLTKIKEDFYLLEFVKQDSVRCQWQIEHPVYQFDWGDVNGDGENEIALGVIKKTRHFKQESKRLFIMRVNRQGQIRPVWMGSKAGDGLEDFKIERDSTPARIITYNRMKDSTIVVNQFKLAAFGIEFEKIIK